MLLPQAQHSIHFLHSILAAINGSSITIFHLLPVSSNIKRLLAAYLMKLRQTTAVRVLRIKTLKYDLYFWDGQISRPEANVFGLVC